MTTPDLVTVGWLGRPRGLEGEIWVTPETDFPERFLGLTEIFVRSRDTWNKLNVVASKVISGRPVLRFEEILTPEDAARLTNCELAVLKNDVVKLPEGSYYIYDLIGCQVFDEKSNQLLGEIVTVERYPANDVYVIRSPDGNEVMCPAVRQYVKTIAVDEKRIVLDRSGILKEKEQENSN